MPDKRRLAAIANVKAEIISKFQGARPLTNAELAAHGSQFKAGWQLPGLLKSETHQLRLLLPESFPFARPRMAIDPLEPVFTWPHLEEHGLLCIAPDDAPHLPENPVASVVQQAIPRAQTLANESLEGRGFEQFEDEFVSYWNRWAKAEKPVRSLCHPVGPSRWVSAWYGKTFTVIAEDDDKLRAWLDGFFGGEMKDKNFTPRRVPFVWPEKAPRPAQYPRNVSALRSLVKADAKSKLLVEDLLLDQEANNKCVLLGCYTRHGVGLGAVYILKPQSYRGGGNPLTKGFRAEPPKSLLLARYGAATVYGANVIRCDPSWVHGRDHNPDIGLLLSKSIVILGVGSVGSSVATLLAKSGVGRITLVDPQVFESENTSRHELGIDSVEKRKAAQLAAFLWQRFPHLTIKAEGKPWQEVARENLEQLTSADLVVSTMGNWSLESELNAMALDHPSFPPILYGWTEPHATAGHAVIFMDRSSCLRCLTDDLGELRIPVTSWAGDTTKQVPACGGSFQPYGAVELDHINAIIAELALDVLTGRAQASTHRTWIGRREVLERSGGEWNLQWVQGHSDPGDGGSVIEMSISGDPQCPACREGA